MTHGTTGRLACYRGASSKLQPSNIMATSDAESPSSHWKQTGRWWGENGLKGASPKTEHFCLDGETDDKGHQDRSQDCLSPCSREDYRAQSHAAVWSPCRPAVLPGCLAEPLPPQTVGLFCCIIFSGKSLL